MHSPILAPVVALIAWSLVMLAWLVAARMPALTAAGIDVRTVRGGKPGGLDGVLPDATQWKAHNYIHLMEQPTLFYAVCGVLALAEAGGGIDLTLAWAYVALRVVHSVVQATVNIVMMRFTLFALSTAALAWLTVDAARAVF